MDTVAVVVVGHSTVVEDRSEEVAVDHSVVAEVLEAVVDHLVVVEEAVVADHLELLMITEIFKKTIVNLDITKICK